MKFKNLTMKELKKFKREWMLMIRKLLSIFLNSIRSKKQPSLLEILSHTLPRLLMESSIMLLDKLSLKTARLITLKLLITTLNLLFKNFKRFKLKRIYLLKLMSLWWLKSVKRLMKKQDTLLILWSLISFLLMISLLN